MRREHDLNVPRVLRVDLSTNSVEVRYRPDLSFWLGGSPLATRLFAEEVALGADALAPEQPFVMAIGPLTAAFPAVTKTAAVFRSPLTGEFGESHAGGRLATALRFAGYDALVVVGASRRPVYLSVSSRDVRLKDAASFWGYPVKETGRILRENEVKLGSGKRSIVRIGPAGEAGVAYAGANVDTYRHFGRLGLGAVMGAKRLKAIVVGGDLSFPLPDTRRYARVYERVYKQAVESSAMQKYHELGTAQNILPLNAIGALPTRNLQSGRFEGAEEISGEAYAEDLLLRKYACFGCPVGCIHIGLLREQFAPGYEYKYGGVSYDYELLYAFGSLLGVSDRTGVLALIDAAEELGLDIMTAGAVLAWLTEAQDGGLVEESALEGRLAFGDAKAYEAALGRLVGGRSELWETARRGTAALAARYGGEFDLQMAGNEISGYHTGYGTLLGHAVGARHSHLDAAGYALDQQHPGAAPASLVEPLMAEEQERCMLTALHACLFARKIYGDREVVREALASLGVERSDKDLDDLGRSALRLKHRLKKAMGFSTAEIRIPKRFLETPTPGGKLSGPALAGAIALYGERIEALLAEADPETPALAAAG
ncbi:MAG: aldehyde ferredoxin oxidoreductase N-terminal domain-containing protein [Chloroflexota bacterium]